MNIFHLARRKTATTLTLAAAAAQSVWFAGIALAAGNVPVVSDVKDVNGKILTPIITWLTTILFGVAVIMVIYAAYLFLMSEGDEEKVRTARRTILYAAVAVAVALLAVGFPEIIASVFGQQTGQAK